MEHLLVPSIHTLEQNVYRYALCALWQYGLARTVNCSESTSLVIRVLHYYWAMEHKEKNFKTTVTLRVLLKCYARIHIAAPATK